jgi:sugar/nucleoside kinase (ribokinase family)
MHDVLTIGSATADIFMKSPDFHLQPTDEGVLLCQEYGGKLDIDQFKMRSGGAGTNTAVGFQRMGFHTAAVVEIGKDMFGQMIWDDLKREQVDTQFVIAEKSEETAVSVMLISADGGRSAMTHRGASSFLEARDIPWDAIPHTRWIHLSNVSGNSELLLTLFDHLKHLRVGLSWNPGHKELQMLATGKLNIQHIPCDVLILNREEWAEIQPVQAEVLRCIPYLVVTNGKLGGDLYIKGKYEHHYDMQAVHTVQETGAGDAFCVGFISAHLSGKSPVVGCQWGVKNSAHVVQSMDAKSGLLYKKDFAL